VNLGPIQFDEELFKKQLRGDMKDDWFADPILFKDMMDGPLVGALFAKNYTQNDGKYEASERDLFNIPKSNFTLRYALETGLSDRLLFHSLTAEIVPLYDPLLGPSIYSHRYDHTAKTHKYLFKKGVGAWNDFIGSVRSALAPGKFLLSTDLTNYYEHIELTRLKAQLIQMLPDLKTGPDEKGRARVLIDLLFSSLPKWTFNEKRGLPQNRDASSFLANIYMVPVDREMEKCGYGKTYFRYMDDIKIVCDSRAEARLALKKLILALRDQELSVNAKKTLIVGATEKSSVDSCLQHVSEEITYIDSVWKTNSPTQIFPVLPMLRKYVLDLMDKGDYESKAFRFCINRLYTLCLCPTLSIPSQYLDPITPKIVAGLDEMPASTDQLCKFLRAAPVSEEHLASVAEFLRDPTRSIYNWQNFHLWVLLTDKKFVSAPLIEHAKHVVATTGDTPTRAGATLYLGAIGDGDAKALIATRFQTLSTFLGQRIAVIGLHEVPYKPLIQDHVKAHLREDLVGCYTAMHKKPGSYCLPLEPVLLGEETLEEMPS
jgi:hypothetical protein